jgi:hypothetical protein
MKGPKLKSQMSSQSGKNNGEKSEQIKMKNGREFAV